MIRPVLAPIVIILTLSGLIFVFQATSLDWLAYYHNGIEKGQWWRLLTAHFCHTNGYHLMLNGFGLPVIIFLFINTFKHVNLYASVAFSALFISTCIYFIDADLQWYVGLSGVLHSLFAIGVCDELRKPDKWAIFLAIGLAAKLASEQLKGPSVELESLINATVMVNAHLYGAIAGIIYFLLSRLLKDNLKNRKR